MLKLSSLTVVVFAKYVSCVLAMSAFVVHALRIGPYMMVTN
jgi:hypothetical protein